MKRAPVLFALLLVGCGRLGFDGHDGSIAEPSLQLQLTFDDSFVDVAQGRSVTCQGPCPLLEAGRTSVAATFDGTQCLEIPSAPELETQELTLAVWFRTTNTDVDTLLGKPLRGATTRDNSYQLWKAPNGTVVFSTAGPTATTAVTGINDMAWHHVAATYSAGAVQIYFDGAPQMSNTVALTSHDSDALLIGCDIDLGAGFGYWNGQLDDVRYYDRALEASEIVVLAQ